jgi:hypothetical protein
MDSERTKRRFPRVRSENPLLVKKLGPEALEGFARTRTMGLGGCGFINPESYGVEAPLELLINVAGRMVSVVGRVAYENPRPDGSKEIGVEFLSIAPEDRKVIEDLFQSRGTVLSEG